MALLDNITKKASEASAKAIQKGKELSDTARLNSLVADEEKKITNTYYQIGKLYATIHRDSYEGEFEGMMAALVESESKISEYRRQIKDIKGVQHCEKCGAEVPKEAAFCSSCGAIMPKVQAPVDLDIVKCKNCGAQVKQGMRFCTSCGKPMSVAVTEAAIIAPENVVMAPVTEYEQTDRICPNCGAQVKQGMRFCTSCGKPMSVAVAEAAIIAPENVVMAPVTEYEQTDRICPNCGAQVDTDFDFCTECGTRF